MSDSPDTTGRKFQPAPFQSAPLHTGSIQGVWLNPTEDVEWTWTHTLDGKSYISGYTIKPKLPMGKEKSDNE
jgi:hypothetical protein